MALLASVAIVLALAFVGSVLHRALARWLLARDEDRMTSTMPSERDLLLLGLLPGLGLVATIGAYTAMIDVLSPMVLGTGLAATVLWCRKDAAATIGAATDLLRDVAGKIRAGNLVAILAVTGFAVVIAALLLRTLIPIDNFDVASFQLPLARSLVAHRGFVYPQVPAVFYAYSPFLYNLLFAEGMMYVDSEATASLLNILVFVGFIATLTVFFRRGKAAGLLVALLVLAPSSYFTVLAASPMPDVTRACFAALAILFGYRYTGSARLYDAVAAGLLAGVGGAGHYFELVPATILGLCLVPQLRNGNRAWRDAGAFVLAFVAVAWFWYTRNWVMTGNPIFPMIFGHAGMPDAEMEAFWSLSLGENNPLGNVYVHNLTSLRGWFGFAHFFTRYVLEIWPGAVSAALLILGMVLGKARPTMLLVATAAMFATWYAVTFDPRWVMDATLLFCATAIVAAAPLVERMATTFDGKIAGKTFAAVGVAFCAALGVQFFYHGTHLVPSWIDTGLLQSIVAGPGTDAYLADQIPGYGIYRYIGDHDLHPVLQLFDVDGSRRAATFNDGRDGAWLIGANEAPSSMGALPQFLSDRGIRYFIEQAGAYPVVGAAPSPGRLAAANTIAAALEPHATLVIKDKFGWSLYAIDAAAFSTNQR